MDMAPYNHTVVDGAQITEEGVMQLMPLDQHEAPGQLQDLLHPGGRGGYADWGQ